MKSFLFLLLFLSFFSSSFAQSAGIDARNFYGIAWRGTAHENLVYAKQMGYDYVFYQPGMEKDPLSSGFRFYIESPDYTIYKRAINTTKSYNKSQVNFYEKFCRLIPNGKSFPLNMATGWQFSPDEFSVELDFQKKSVVKWAIDSIMQKIAIIQERNPLFYFGGFAWDVPQLSGDFWAISPKTSKREQVTSVYWDDLSTANKTSFNKNNEYFSYEEGRYIFYKNLFARARAKYKNVDVIMEPSKIYTDWISKIEKFKDPRSVMPTILCQESKGTDFLNDSSIYKNGLIGKSYVMCTSPSYYTFTESKSIACQAAKVGAGFGWFGRMGGSGSAPNYQSIGEVPPELKLIRLLTNWENLNKTAISDRNWDGSNYTSTHAVVNEDLIALIQPSTNKIFIVFLTSKGIYTMPKGSIFLKAFSTTKLFVEDKDITSEVLRSGNTIRVAASQIGKGLILSFTKS
ncbi:hypothetical protein ACUN24_02690 [Pedobacter sp. WC2501]|uniref:hypothetical protein n=1 Tax=Pedobacter sp. WC2501 TaxID=3461400 RepID=UPI00404664AF